MRAKGTRPEYAVAVAKLPLRHLRAVPAIGGMLLAFNLAGCASWGTHANSVAVCQGGFANDPEWGRARWAGPRGRELLRRYPTFEFEGRTSRPLKPSTLWFRNHVSQDMASCSMHSCDTGRCVWRVRLYSRQADRWSLRSEYDLGEPRNVSGQR